MILFFLNLILFNTVALADEKLTVPSDPKATYYILENGGTKIQPTLTTKRVGPSGESFAKRIFDCQKQTTKYLADSETLEGLKKSTPEKKMSPIVKESIAWFQFKHVCQ